MPVTAYASPDQAGNITDMDMSKGRTYRYLQGEPVYPFGFGLSKQSTLSVLSAGCQCERSWQGASTMERTKLTSFSGLSSCCDHCIAVGYTTWEYASLQTNSSGSVLPTSAVGVTMGVKNTGAIDSAQVIQLYAALSSDFASTPANISRHIPVRQLVAFQKVFVRSGESQDVSMAFVPDQLAGWNLFHRANGVTVHLAAGDVSPTSKTLSNLQITSVNVQ
jgi:hypothetical protein